MSLTTKVKVAKFSFLNEESYNKTVIDFNFGRHKDVSTLKETKSVTLNIFRKKSFLLKSFVKVELSYVFTVKMLSTAENCMEK